MQWPLTDMGKTYLHNIHLIFMQWQRMKILIFFIFSLENRAHSVVGDSALPGDP